MSRFRKLSKARRIVLLIVFGVFLAAMSAWESLMLPHHQLWLANHASMGQVCIYLVTVVTLCILLIRGGNRLMDRLATSPEKDRPWCSPLFILLNFVIVVLMPLGYGLFLLVDAFMIRLIPATPVAETVLSVLGVVILVLIAVRGLRNWGKEK